MMGRATLKAVHGKENTETNRWAAYIYMQWEIKTCCIDADSASYFSFTEGGPIKQNLAYFWYKGLHIDVTCVGDVNNMGRVRKSGSNVMVFFSQ